MPAATSGSGDLISLSEGERDLKARGVKPNSRHFLETHVAKGNLRARRMAARVLLIRRADLDAFAEAYCSPEAA